MKKIYVTGVSGTGKTTIARELNTRGYLAISIDETEGLCSWIDQKTGEHHGGKEAEMTKEFVDTHNWVCDIDHLNQLLAKSDASIAFVLGMAGNHEDLLHLFDTIILLQCSPETFCKRIETRTDNDFGKDREVQRQIVRRSKTYAEEMLAIGAVAIDTEKSIDEVVDEIIKISNR